MTPTGPFPPPGSVAFTAAGATISEPGLRLLVDPADGSMEVLVEGLPAGSDTVEACPVGGVSAAPDATRCVVAAAGRRVALGLGEGSATRPETRLRGVLLRPSGGSTAGPVEVPEVTFTYRPASAAVTLVTPPLPPPGTPGECPGGPCLMSFEVAPTGAGTLRLDADGRGARPQLTLRSGREGDGSSRVVSLVEGGGRLTIRSTVEAGPGTVLVLRNLGETALPPLELALVWPLAT